MIRYAAHPGATLLTTRDGLLLHTPDQQIYEIETDPGLAAATARLFATGSAGVADLEPPEGGAGRVVDADGAGGPAAVDAVAGPAPSADLDAAVALFIGSGAWVPATVTTSLLRPLRVRVVGPGGWERGLVASAVTPWVAAVTVIEPARGRDVGCSAATGPDCDVVIGIAPVIADRAWIELARACRGAGVAFVPMHREGADWYLGPWAGIADGPRCADYRDLRARRLAASPCPDALATLWAHLDDHGASWPLHQDDVVPMLGALGALLECLACHAEDAPTPATNAQLGFASGGQCQRHPVLPLPAHLLAEVRDGSAHDAHAVPQAAGL